MASTRNWSHQEVSHVLKGLRSTDASHRFVHVYIAEKSSRLKKKIEQDTKQDPAKTSAMVKNKWQLYLERSDYVDALLKLYSEARREDVMDLSVVEFYQQFVYRSGGSKGGRLLKYTIHPTIVVSKPRMPSFWHNEGHANRAIYSKHMLMLHRCFADLKDWNNYTAAFDGDYEEAYYNFYIEGDASSVVNDDFQPIPMFTPDDDDDEDIDMFTAHPDFSVYLDSVAQDYTESRSNAVDVVFNGLSSATNWKERTANSYTQEKIKEAENFTAMQHKKLCDSGNAERPNDVDIAKLNPNQLFLFNIVADHFFDTAVNKDQLLLMVNGTAGASFSPFSAVIVFSLLSFSLTIYALYMSL